MNWPLLACSLWIVLDASPFNGCGDRPHPRNPCTIDPQFAISVDTRSEDGLVVDEVTADLHEEAECRQSLADRRAFDCAYQGTGDYTLVLHSGKLTWTQKIGIIRDPNSCLVKTQDLTIDVTRAGADK